MNLTRITDTILTTIASAVTVFIAAKVLAMGWSWFVVPLGVPEISTVQAIGLLVLVQLPDFIKFRGDHEMSIGSFVTLRFITLALTGLVLYGLHLL